MGTFLKIFGLTMAAMMLLSVFGLTGCGNSHGIPNGDYVIQASTENVGTTYSLLPKDEPEDYFLRIKGNKAIWYASNQKSSEDEIIKEEGKVYFVSYDDEHTEICRNLVEYDETTKTFTVFSPQ